MRFSAFAVSAAIFGVAMATPTTVVYETDVVTITSCAPEKTSCPGRLHSSSSMSTSVYSSSVPVVTPSSYPAMSSYPTMSSSYYRNGTASASTPPVMKPTATTTWTTMAPTTVPLSTGYPWTPSASAGVPHAPANTSTPVVPTSPSQSFEGAASIKGFSFAALAVAAAALVLT